MHIVGTYDRRASLGIPRSWGIRHLSRAYRSGMSVGQQCERITDARELRLALLDELHRLVPFDWFAWLLTDPSSEVGTAPIADVPCPPDLPRLIRLKYATTTNRWTQQTEPVSRLHAATAG